MIWSEMGVLVQATRQRARTLTWTETWWKMGIARWWNFNYLIDFVCPDLWGNDPIFTCAYFSQMGWLNHQLATMISGLDFECCFPMFCRVFAKICFLWGWRLIIEILFHPGDISPQTFDNHLENWQFFKCFRTAVFVTRDVFVKLPGSMWWWWRDSSCYTFPEF